MALTPAAPRSRAPGAEQVRRSWASLPALVLEEARPVVQRMYLLRFTVGYALVDVDHLMSWRVAVGVLSWLLATVAVYTLNGVADYDEDVGNASDRPIARGDLPQRWATIACVVATVGSVALAAREQAMLPWLLLFLLLGWLYSLGPFPAKRRTESAAVVVFGLGWASYLAGSAAAGGHRLDLAVAVVAGTASAWMALVGAVVKDLSDLTGDAVGGRRTLAVCYGPRKAQQIGCAGALLVGLGGVAASLVWAPITLSGTVPYLLGALWLCSPWGRNPVMTKVENRKLWRKSYRVFMRTQYAANVSLLIALLASFGR